MEYTHRVIIVRSSWSHSEHRYSICGGCSAMVADEAVHDAWHENQGRISAMAERSAAWTTPLA